LKSREKNQLTSTFVSARIEEYFYLHSVHCHLFHN
jgi:hypothetical protein